MTLMSYQMMMAGMVTLKYLLRLRGPVLAAVMSNLWCGESSIMRKYFNEGINSPVAVLNERMDKIIKK